MKLKTLLPALILVLAMLACNFPSNVPVTETPTLQIPTFPVATQLLPTSPPMQTPLPGDTAPPPPTATPSVPVVYPKDVAVNCRLGPGTAWVVLSGLNAGTSAQITGRSSDGTWWNIVDPFNSSRRCWVSASVVNTAGNLGAIQVLEASRASVTNVTVDVEPDTIAVAGCVGPIPPLAIEGAIETNGPTSVTWRFETQQGGAMTSQTTNFETFGSREFSAEYTPPITAGTYWIRLIVTSPNEMQAETRYTITCP